MNCFSWSKKLASIFMAGILTMQVLPVSVAAGTQSTSIPSFAGEYGQILALGAERNNMAVNGGFEDGMANWEGRGIPCAFLTDTQVHSGTRAAYFGYFKKEQMNNYIDQECAVSKVGSYVLSVYLKTDATLTGAGAQILLEAKDKNGDIIAIATSHTVANTGGNWQLVSITLNAPVNTASITAKIGGIYCTGAFYVDDVELIFVS